MPRESTLTPEQREQRDREKRQRWLREGSRRTDAALKAMERLSKCANRQLYTYTDEEVQAAITALREAFGDMVSSFNSADGGAQRQGFLLPGATAQDVAPRERKKNGQKQPQPRTK